MSGLDFPAAAAGHFKVECLFVIAKGKFPWRKIGECELARVSELNKSDIIKKIQGRKVNSVSIVDIGINVEYEWKKVFSFPDESAEHGEQTGFDFVQI